jgi:hypothetical protein
MADSEQGLKWWLRYIIVPLIGGGGIIGIVIAIISRPQFPQNTVPPDATINQEPALISGTPVEKESEPQIRALRKVSRADQPLTLGGKLDEDARSRTESLTYAVHPIVNESTTQQLLGATLNLEDITGQHWKLRNASLEYYHGASIEPGLDRFQSQKDAPSGKRSAPLVIRIGRIDFLIPFDALVKLERKSELNPTFEVTYDWLGRRQVLQGDIRMPDNSYGKYNVIGINSKNDTVALPLSRLKRLAFEHPGPASTPTGQNRSLSFPATIQLSNKTSIAVAELRRVSHYSPYCYHHANFPYKQGSAEVDAPFEKLRSIEFLVAPNKLHITYQDGKAHEGFVAKDKLFDNPYVGFSGISQIGEAFAWAADVSAVRFEAVQ